MRRRRSDPYYGMVMNGPQVGREPAATLEGVDAVTTGYIYGLELSRASTTTVDIGTGAARADDDSITIGVSATLTLDTATTGANGLESTVAGDTWYYVWVISSTDGSSVAAFGSTGTSPTLPSGYTKKRLAGWIRTDSSDEVYDFIWSGRGPDVYIAWAASAALSARVVVNAGSSGTFASVSCADWTAPGSRFCTFMASLTGTALGFYGPAGDGVDAKHINGTDVAEVADRVPMSAARAIEYRRSAGSGLIYLRLDGYYASR